ncbi:MAG: hypothetical protein KIY12_08955 [Thermoplasmata archaeon]|uniref:Uncharacterized protein n=1 Tax=Candidatus Sysuiplasma superficiale TaxID=2823368 RepID=A0A8J8CDR5_9ARCH|nr:hypothetical protein [Candidatus Sysuiplasma superficiale]
MPKQPYVKTVPVNLRLPEGLYEEVIRILEKERKWNSPQQFIQDALNEKIDRWKRDHAVG